MTKALLLPMDRASASEQSLANHLALVACRSGHGNGHLVNELMRAVYLSWFLRRAGYGTVPVEQFKIAECAVEATLSHAHGCGEWRPTSWAARNAHCAVDHVVAKISHRPCCRVPQKVKTVPGK
jgi:hypothetical protein